MLTFLLSFSNLRSILGEDTPANLSCTFYQYQLFISELIRDNSREALEDYSVIIGLHLKYLVKYYGKS